MKNSTKRSNNIKGATYRHSSNDRIDNIETGALVTRSKVWVINDIKLETLNILTKIFWWHSY